MRSSVGEERFREHREGQAGIDPLLLVNQHDSGATRPRSLSDPNDEAVSGHRQYSRGLSEVLWAGLVQDSTLVAALERQNRVHPYHQACRFDRLQHHVLLTKECVAEVVAEDVNVSRIEGTTLDAAAYAARS